MQWSSQMAAGPRWILASDLRPAVRAKEMQENTFDTFDTFDAFDAFDAFSQADAPNSRRYQVSGFGLAVSQQSVALMGGHIKSIVH